MSTTVADPLLGRLLDGRYAVRRRLATGGMATVYAAVDTRLDRPVAVKVMHPALAADEQFVARFRREAKAAARLSSPTVVNVSDQGQDGTVVFLVMELVDGSTLREVLRNEGSLPPEEAVAVLEPVVRALATAHAAGYVHRDVKPENVLIGHDGSIKVGDFGLARAVDQSPITATTGLLLGTVAYLAPEQVRRGVADARTDVYACGVLLFEVLTGRPPYEGDTAISVAYQHLHDRVPAPSTFVPGIGEDLDDLVLQATEPDPDDRPRDAGALLVDLREVAAGLPPARGVRLRRVLLPVAAGSAPAAAPESDDETADDTDEIGQRGGEVRAPTVRFTRGADGKLRAVRAEGATTVDAPRRSTRDAQRTDPVDLAKGRPTPDDDELETFDDENLDDQHVDDHVADDDAASADTRGSRRSRAFAPLARLRRLRPATLTWIALVLVTLLAVGSVWWVVAGRGIEVPQTAALDPVAAESRLRAHGFTVVRGADEYSETAPRGTVAVTSPAAGDHVDQGSRVSLRVSRGPERYTLVPLRGRPYGEAVAALGTQKQEVGPVTRAFDDDIPAETVVASDPAAGAVLRPGTPVGLVVSDGPAPVVAPNVVGQPVADAERTLQGLGLRVNRRGIYSDTVPLNQVTELQPAAELRRKQEVSLVYSLGPELIEIPNVVGQTRSSAIATLQGLGFRVRVLNVPGFDSFVARAVPSAGTKARRGSQITVVLA
ncbi:MAG: eukaryotic-like serine/threonine-protein kinase [Frankiaceae bacterium]|nr:eukaryotic-like serine/threonine-protein kinase [Frankiaceae bacterium]